ncbi:MAG: hypothetical protein AAF456_21420 [Planctomycetota bacterium]
MDSTVLSQLETYRGAFGFEQSRVTSRSGDDRVEIEGTGNEDRLFATTRLARVTAEGYFAQALGFGSVSVDLGAGFDPAIFRGDELNQELLLTPASASYTSATMRLDVANLERTTSNLSTGLDTLVVDGGQGQEVVNARYGNVLVVGPTYSHRVYASGSVVLNATGGNDRFTLNSSGSQDQFSVTPETTRWTREGSFIELNNFANALILGGGGNDTLSLNGTEGDDSLYLANSILALSGSGTTVVAREFGTIDYQGGGGNDLVTLIEESGNSVLRVERERVELQTATTTTTIGDVDSVIARSILDDDLDVIEILDGDLEFLFEAVGDWTSN